MTSKSSGMSFEASSSRGSQRLALRLVFSTVPFCHGAEGSQKQVCVPTSACRCGQSINSEPRSKVTDLRATRGRVRMTSASFPMTRAVALFAFTSKTVKRLTRSTKDVTFALPNFCRNNIKSDSQCPNWIRSSMISGRFEIPRSGWILGFFGMRPLRGRRLRRCSGRYHQRSSFMPSGE